MSSSEINPKLFFEELKQPKTPEILLKKLLDLSQENPLLLIDFIIFLMKNNLLR